MGKQTKTGSKLSGKLINSFLLPNIGQSLFIQLELVYMSYFLTDLCGFDLGVVTFILTSTAAVDLVWVFVTGIVIEKCEFRKLGKYRAWYIICTPVILVFFTLMFFDAVNSAAAAGMVVIAFCIKTLFQDIISAAVTGHISQVTDDPNTRTLLSARRNQGAIIGQLLFSVIGIPCITMFGKAVGSDSMGYTIAAAFFCVINLIVNYIMFVMTKDAPIAATEKIAQGSKLSVGEMFGVLFRNKPLLVISFGDLLRYTAIFLVSSTAAYFFDNVLKDSGALSIYMTIQTVTGVIGALVVNQIAKRMGKKAIYCLCTLVYGGILTLMFFLAGEGRTTMFIVFMAVAFFFNSMIGTVVTAMTTDTVIYTMWKDGKNARGFIMSMLNIPIKFGSMIKSIILPVGLSAIGYVAGQAASPAVAKGLSGIMCLASGICVLLSCVIIFCGYHLTEKKVTELTEILEKRQAEKHE